MRVIRLAGLDELLHGQSRIVITTHAKPDGDAIGSSMGLYHYMIAKGLQVAVVIPNAMPDFLHIVPEANTVCVDYELNKELATKLIQEATLICCLDYNRLSRVGDLEPIIKQSSAPRLNIDHHLGLDESAFDFIYSDASKSSTCEMIYDFICMREPDTSIFTLPIIHSLYTGMVTDTGSFRFPSTNANVHRAVALFMEQGLIHAPIHERINDSWSLDRLRFLGDLLLNHLHYYEPGYAIIYINPELQQQYNIATGDTEGIVNTILSIAKVKVAVLATQRGEEIKISFRSKGEIDVNRFAQNQFGGGGHLNAAGASSFKKWDEVQRQLNAELPAYIFQYHLN